MTAPLELPALDGTNPLGFMAALGILDVLTRRGVPAKLAWTENLVPRPLLHNVPPMEDVIEHLEADLDRWRVSPLLTWGSPPPKDAKLREPELRSWTVAVSEHGEQADRDLLAAIVAEGAVAGKGDSKPSHLHFTAGQQAFLDMARDLRDGLDADAFREALVGPWRRASKLPVFGWEAGGERVYALRATNPSTEKKLGVPGAEWLAWLALSYFPVVNRGGVLLTTACARPWKRGGWLRWPLWKPRLGRDVVRSLLGDSSLWALSEDELARRGVIRVVEAPIRRSDQGGYGSFGAAGAVRRADGR